MTLPKLNFHLLFALGLSQDSAVMVMDRINELEQEGSQLRQAVGLLTCLHPTMVMMSDEPLEMARAIARHVKAERDQVEQKLNDALVENAKLWDVVKHDSDRMGVMMTQLAAAGIAPAP